MSRFLCRYLRDASGTWFESDELLPPQTYACKVPEDGGGNVQTPTVPGMRYVLPEDADYGDSPSGPDFPGMVNPPTGGTPRQSFLTQLADAVDSIPTAPGFQPVPKTECAWCRVTKKLAPWLGFVVVGLVVAWLSRKFIR